MMGVNELWIQIESVVRAHNMVLKGDFRRRKKKEALRFALCRFLPG